MHSVADPAKLQTSVLLCFSLHCLSFHPGRCPVPCPGPYPPSVQPPHRAADAVISPQITPANWDQHRDTWVQSGGSGVLEPAKQSWFDRFPLNPDEVQKKKKKKCMRVCYVCACCQACLKKSQPRVLAWQSGVRCAVSPLTWPGSSVRVCSWVG